MTNPSPRRVIPLKVERSSTLNASERKAILEACERGKSLPGGLLPILHSVQESLGFVPPDAIALIAHELNLSRAEVHGVVTFYHYFRTQRSGRHVVHVCRAEACQALGAVGLEAHAKKSLGVEFHGTSADGAVTLEPVYCLGNCALGPSLMIDDQLQGRVSAERCHQLIDELMASLRAQSRHA
jgi:formate dehydrogenase subunit gamma